MATDPQNNVTLLFGGLASSRACLNDTWELVNGTWTNLTLSYAPPIDCAGSLVWDARDGYFLQFGGDPGLGNTAYNQTWAFWNGSWHNLTKSVAPHQGFAVGLVYDPLDRYVLAFGGIQGGFGSINYTWTYQGGNWTNITSTAGPAPAPRGFVGLTYDGLRDRVYLFGGRDYLTTSPGYDYNDTWSFSGGKWTEVLNGTTYGPSVRRVAGFAYDPRYGYDLMVGGESNAPYAITYEELNDTWIFNGTNWRNVTASTSTFAPTGGFGAGFAFVDNATGDLEFGQCTSGGCGTVDSGEWTYHWNLSATLTANRTVVLAGAPFTLTANVSGGSFQWALNYSDLPPGCPSTNAPVLTCRTNVTGNFTPHLTAQQVGYLTTNLTVASSTISIVADLTNQPLASNQVDFHQTEWINSTPAGGLPGYTYAYSGLPAGCASADVADLACTANASGHFKVKVTVTDSAKDVAVAYANFTVNEPLSLKLTVSPSEVDVGHMVNFTATPAGGDGDYQYLWLGLPAVCQNTSGPIASCVPTTHGFVNVSVVLEDTLNGTPALADASAQVAVVPSVSIQAIPANGTAPLTVAFSAVPSGGVAPFVFDWVFGDGTTSTSPDVSHTYYAAGTYSPTIWVNDSEGLGAHTSVAVLVIAAPSVDLTANLWSTEVGQTVTFNASAAGGTLPYAYQWAGLPAGCSSADTPLLACSPTAAGVFAVTVTVTDGAKATFSHSHSLAVASRLTAAASASEVSACGYPENVSYVAVPEGGLGPYTFDWVLPDGSSASTSSLTHEFRASPSGFAVVTVTDSVGAKVSANVTAPAATVCASSPAPPSSAAGTPAWEWVALGVVIAAVAATVGIVVGRRRPPAPPDDAGGAEGYDPELGPDDRPA